MRNYIKLLDIELFNNKNLLNKISYWLKVMNRPNGWHYDLDQIWVIEQLKENGIHPGSTILDAGAGQGVTQYLLSSMGYNIISLDFSSRIKPPRSNGIFNIEIKGDEEILYKHPYMNFIDYNINNNKLLRIITVLKFFKYIPYKIVYLLQSYIYYIYERYFTNHENYGKITYIRAPFHDIPLLDSSIDAIISISAIEHADIDLFEKNILEMTRILKSNSPMLITTSATNETENKFLEKFSGWCFSQTFLKNKFKNATFLFDYNDTYKNLLNSKILKSRIDPYYYNDKESFCYKKNIINIPYLPMGIKIYK